MKTPKEIPTTEIYLIGDDAPITVKRHFMEITDVHQDAYGFTVELVSNGRQGLIPKTAVSCMFEGKPLTVYT